MKTLFKNLILFSTLLLSFAGSGQAIKCKLTGQIIGRNSNTLVLFRATEDPDHGTQILIPIKNGKFEYTLTALCTEAYFLIFQDELEQGIYRYIYFFPENGNTFFKLHSSEESKLNEIIGGKLTAQYYDYYKLNKDTFRQEKKQSGIVFQN